MIKRLATTTLGLLLCLTAAVRAQGVDVSEVDISEVNIRKIREIRQNSELLARVLSEALELNESAGLFARAVGGVNGTYLHDQGIVLEVRSPLASRRSRLNIASLNSTMRALTGRRNPFAAFQATSPAQTNVVDGDGSSISRADSFYQEMMGRIASVDYALAINSAIQQASTAARSISSLGGFDAIDEQSVQSSLTELRRRLEVNLTELRSLEASIRSSATDRGGDSEQDRRRLEQQLDALMARLDPLQAEASELARDLQARMEVARQDYEAEWLTELERLEDNLYGALCDYGASLRALPADEYVSVILIGLGVESEAGSRPDKIHVLARSEIQRCQNGSIAVPELRGLSTEYSY